MRVCSLASSSKGNCTIVYSDAEILLVDMGITLKDLEEKFNRLSLDPNNITGVLVSHEHGDHTKGIASLVKKYGVKVYCHYNGYEGIKQKSKLRDLDVIRFNDL